MTQFRVQVQVRNRVEPSLAHITFNRRLSVRYLPSYLVGERLGLPGLVLSRITGTIQVERGSQDK